MAPLYIQVFGLGPCSPLSAVTQGDTDDDLDRDKWMTTVVAAHPLVTVAVFTLLMMVIHTLVENVAVFT